MNEKTQLTPTAEDRLASIEERMQQGSDRMDLLDAEMTKNTDLTQEIRDIMAAARVGFKVLGGLGTAFKWAGTLSAAAVAIYTALYAILHGGSTPK
jgi:hypothetical protein